VNGAKLSVCLKDDKFDVVVENSKKSTKGKAKKKAANLKTEGLTELGKFCVPF
jgi:hypothetical protein